MTPESVNAARARLAGHPPLSPKTHTVYSPTVVVQHDGDIHAALSCRVDSFVKLEAGEGMYIGELVHIASFCHLGIGGGLTILEDGSSFGSGAKVISGSNVAGAGHGCSAIAPDAIIKRSYVHIAKNATLYAGAIVLPGVTVGVGAVIAAGAVVRDDVPAGEIWAGVPARRVGSTHKDAPLVRGRYICNAPLGDGRSCANPRRRTARLCPSCEAAADVER